MKKFLMCSMLTCVAVTISADAADKTVKWTAPVERVDGSPLAKSEIANYDIEVAPGKCATAQSFTIVTSPASSALSAIINLAAGDWCVRMFTVDTDKRRSGPSNAVDVNVPKTAPLPPTNLEVK